MKQEDKLKEEAEFWITYIYDWKAKRDEPVPEKAWSLLGNALSRLRHYYSSKNRAKTYQAENRSMH